MENLILTATFSGPPTLLHLPPSSQMYKKPNPGFVLTRDAKRLKWVTFFPVSVGTFTLFLYQDFQGKQRWLNLQAFSKTLRWYVLQRTGEHDQPGAGTSLPRATCQPTFSKEMHPQTFLYIQGDDTYRILFWNNDSVLKVLQMNQRDQQKHKHF